MITYSLKGLHLVRHHMVRGKTELELRDHGGSLLQPSQRNLHTLEPAQENQKSVCFRGKTG